MMADAFGMEHLYLSHTAVIDWQNTAIRTQARALRDRDSVNTARNCFEWVRDEIGHSMDHQYSRVTWSASQVIRAGHGLCYAKSHLLAALLRANGIAAGFSYQRLRDDAGSFCLHGFNGLYLPELGWYRVDARGNKPGINAGFDPPDEKLAFSNAQTGEIDYGMIVPQPWPGVVQALQQARDLMQLWANLPAEIIMG
ncbi:MAG: transglutaminase family protein [Gammaproteobacteria bacterium]|nr:transglutaminase family protein [Gammaproteobacteria bacterium]MDH5801860.1 transglutaminase family protein [Gammaproteobacteria bacterium]